MLETPISWGLGIYFEFYFEPSRTIHGAELSLASPAIGSAPGIAPLKSGLKSGTDLQPHEIGVSSLHCWLSQCKDKPCEVCWKCLSMHVETFVFIVEMWNHCQCTRLMSVCLLFLYIKEHRRRIKKQDPITFGIQAASYVMVSWMQGQKQNLLPCNE